MLPKSQLVKLFSRSLSQKRTDFYASRRYLRNSLCTASSSAEVNESCEIPRRVKLLDENRGESPDSDESFVIPSLAPWVKSYRSYGSNRVNEKTDVDEICKILRNRYSSPDLVVEALSIYDFHISNIMIEHLLKRFSTDWIPAFGIFTWAKVRKGCQHPRVLCDLMVDILGKSMKFHLMWKLIEELKTLEGYVTLETMRKVMGRLARAGKYQEAIEAFKEVEHFGLKRDIAGMNVLMDALAKENGIDHAYEVFLQFKESIGCDVRSYNILIHGFCKCRKFDHARKIMQDMEIQGLRPNVITYTCFVEGYSREQDFRNLNAILDEMKEKSCMPDVVTYTNVVLGLGKAKQINDALEVYVKMKHSGCALDSSFYRSLFHILSRAGRYEDAWDIYEDMGKQGVKPDLLTYNMVIAAACKRLQEGRALKVLERMEENSCKPDLKTYSFLLKMCCRKKRRKVLRLLLTHIFKHDVSIDLSTYALLIRGLCHAGKLEEACSFFEEMVSRGMVPWETTYNLLVQKLDAMSMEKHKEEIEKLMSSAKQ